MNRFTLTARWLFPVAGPPLEHGIIAIAGDRIESVYPQGTLTADIDLGNAAIIPGLVNAHTHLDLSGARGLIPPTSPSDFCDWLRGVIEYRRNLHPDTTRQHIQLGLSECLAAGTTLIGDFNVGGTSAPILQAAPIRSMLYLEIIGTSRNRFDQRLQQFLQLQSEQTHSCRIAPGPHAPYSVHHLAAVQCLNQYGGAMHLAESPGELELLRFHTGRFVEFLKSLNAWQDDGLQLDVLDFIRLTTHSPTRKLFIHGNYLEAAALHDTQSLVYCPRTHAAFGHPPHPARDFLAKGARVALGTDSLASNPDLDLLAEGRFLASLHPELPGQVILRMMTFHGAEALGWAAECGSLAAGKSADLLVVPLADRQTADPHDLILREAIDGPRRCMFRGLWRNASA